MEAELNIFNKYFLNCKAYNINNIKSLIGPEKKVLGHPCPRLKESIVHNFHHRNESFV